MAKAKTNDSLSIDKYLSVLPLEQQILLENVRSIIKKTVPEAIEYISYKMPAYDYHGMIGGFAAFKSHCSFFPWDSTTITVFKAELKNYKTSKGAIQFTSENPIPEELIQKIILFKVAENQEKQQK